MPTKYFASSDPHQLGLQMLRMWAVVCILHADLGGPAVGDMWGLYLLSLSGVCICSVSILHAGLGVQLSRTCGVCICFAGRLEGPAPAELFGLYLLSFSWVADLGVQPSGICAVICMWDSRRRTRRSSMRAGGRAVGGAARKKEQENAEEAGWNTERWQERISQPHLKGGEHMEGSILSP